MSGPPPMTPRPEHVGGHAPARSMAARQRYSVTGDVSGIVDVVSYLLLMPTWRFDPRRHCKGMDAEDFFGSDDMAKLVCPGCPVLKECRDWAIENHEFGVWGGTSERSRRILRRQRKAAS